MTLKERLQLLTERIATEFNSLTAGTKDVMNALKLGGKTLATIESEYTAASNTAADGAVTTVRGGVDAAYNTLKKLYDWVVSIVVGGNTTNYKGLFDATGGAWPANPLHGWFYKVSVSGTVLGVQLSAGDTIIYNADSVSWDVVPSANDVTTVNGQTGAVTLVTDDINEGASYLYFTNARADARITVKCGDTDTDYVTIFNTALNA